MAEENKESVRGREGKASESEKREKERLDKGGKLKAVIAAAVVIAVIGVLLYSVQTKPQNPYQKEFAGEVRNFRANLIEAEKVPVYPSADAIRNIFLGGNVSRISIYYIEGGENGAYGAAAMEFTIKLGTIYKSYNGGEGYTFGEGNRENCLFFYKTGGSVCFDIEALKNASGISSVKSSEDNPALVLLGPPFANRTAVAVSGFTVNAEGKSFNGRQYTDLDLAVDKILLELMKVGEA